MELQSHRHPNSWKCDISTGKVAVALFAFGTRPFGSAWRPSRLRHRRRIARGNAILEFTIEFFVKLLVLTLRQAFPDLIFVSLDLRVFADLG
jgi:hypothetical protein